MADFRRDDGVERRDAAAGYTIQGVSDLTGGSGSGVDTRVDLVCDPNLSQEDRTPTRAFATECVAPPSAATNRIGTARGDEIIETRLLELGPLVHEEHPVRRQPAPVQFGQAV